MYESFYGLQTRPFQLSPDPRFFFGSKGHRRAFSYLRYGIKQGEGFVVVTGEVGTGKTMLAAALLHALKGQNVIARQLVFTQLEAEELLRMVAAIYGLPYEGLSKTGLLRGLEEYFRTCVQQGRRVLLVVDEVQNLPAPALEELRMLSNFQWKGRPLLQSFLLGQREFRDRMRSEGFEQMRQRVAAACHLEPLGPEETRAYILHRLQTAGWTGDPEFSEEIFPAVHAFTGGIPRRINNLCDRLLLYGYLEELHGLDAEALSTVSRELAEEANGAPGQSDADPCAADAEGSAGGAAERGATDRGTDSEQAEGNPEAVPTLHTAVGAGAGGAGKPDPEATTQDELALLRRLAKDWKRGHGP